MGFISKNSDNVLSAYLTQKGRELLLNGDRDESIAKYFLLGDSDRNYNVATHNQIKSMPVADITGDHQDSLYSLAPNIDIRYRVGNYKPVEETSGGFEKKIVYAATPDLSGVNLKMSIGSRSNGDEEDEMFGNMFTTFNLPTTVDAINQYTSGKFLNTAISHLNQDEILIVEIPKGNYGELIDGKSIKLTLPLSGGSQADIYSTFFKHQLVDSDGHALYSDPNEVSKEFGSTYGIDILPGQHGNVAPISGYSSNVAYLFSDYVKRPKGNASNTWANSFGYFNTETNVPVGKKKDKFYAEYSGSNMDTPVGVAYLDKGFLVITDPTIISNLKTTGRTLSAITGTSLEQFYFTNTNDASLSFSSFNTEFIQHAVCVCLPNEFYTSTNPSFNSNFPVAITEVGIFNKNYDLIALAKSNRPIAKDRTSVLSFDISIRI